MKCKRGQVSTELLVIVGLVLLVFIPLLVLVYFKATETNEQIAALQAEMVVFRLAHLSNSVGSLGTNSTIYTDVYIPQNLINLSISTVGRGGEISLKLLTTEGETEIVEVVKYPFKTDKKTLASGPTYGWARFRVTSVYEGGEGRVEITRVS